MISGALWRTATVAVLLGSSACTSAPEPAGPPTPVTSGSAPTTDAGATPTTSAPSPGSLDKPARASGPLSRRSFPTPKRLGDGWRFAVDPGDAEEGYAGNGTPTLARDPREVLQTAVPFGCDRGSRMPLPEHALEADYTFQRRSAIAVRSKFADAATAQTFFDGRADNLRDCIGRTGSPAIGPLVTTLSRPARDAVVSDRTPRSDPWSELAVRDRDTVVLVAVQGAALSPAQNRRLVEAFRR